jgi:anti-sigma factor RsiW
MTHPSDSISDADLHAYIDDQLTPARRIAVEEYLSRHPQLAARIMADLRTQDELRMAMGAPFPVASIETQEAARRLEAALTRDFHFARLRRMAAVAALIAVGWFAHVEFTSVGSWGGMQASAMPAYVDEAARAHRTSLLRASMLSQTSQPTYDRDEIRNMTSIAVPDLPGSWQVLDVQIFPSAAGPALEMAIKAESLGTLSLFAVRPGGFEVMPATITTQNDVTTVYWQIGDVAYALVGVAEGKALAEAAAQLASTLY